VQPPLFADPINFFIGKPATTTRDITWSNSATAIGCKVSAIVSANAGHKFHTESFSIIPIFF
jgi:hypothetical protein